jgi:flagellar basal-body rod protein FlgG
MDWQMGSFTSTSDGSKFALREQDLFLRVRTPAGQIGYTRTGDIRVDQEGKLTTKSGSLVLDDIDQPIVISSGAGGQADFSEIKISANGQLSMKGQSIAQMGLYRIPDLNKLEPIGKGDYLYSGDDRMQLARTNGGTQRFFEQSNTHSVSEMIQMITNQRGFQSTMSSLQTLGRIKESYVNAFNR